MVVASHALSLVAVVPQGDSAPLWVDDLASETPASVFLTTTADILDHLELEMPDALVLGTHDSELLDCLQDLFELHSHRPAIILCSESEPDERYDHLVDLVVPPFGSPILIHQIQRAIRQNTQRIALENEIFDLRQYQIKHQQAMADIGALKNAVVHNVSHELNTPLLQVKSAVALIAEDMDNNSLVDYALRATARLEAAVKNITQLAASLNDMQMSPLIVRDLIDSALRELRRTWEHKPHLARVDVTLDEKLPPALGNRQGISIVLHQLIDNALKFSQDRVEVVARCQHEVVEISIRDYGIGIAKDEMEKIFDSFYRTDPKSTTRNFNGTGVGLANVCLILERHGVEIEVSSVKGKGSTFSFHLPVANLKS